MSARRAARGAVLATMAVAFVAGCALKEPFERTNPFDPGFEYELFVTGPDSVHTQGERFTMTLESSGPLPPGELFVGWRTGNPTIVTGGAGGDFMVLSSSATYVPVALSAELGPDVVVSKTVYVGQGAATLALSCPPAPCDDVPYAIGNTIDVHVQMRDANTNVMSQAALQRAQVTSRNNAVVTPAAQLIGPGYVRVAAMGAGTTWVVIRVDRATDSVRVVVAP
jgi:hypothetical protein